jgi:hypothetical protein
MPLVRVLTEAVAGGRGRQLCKKLEYAVARGIRWIPWAQEAATSEGAARRPLDDLPRYFPPWVAEEAHADRGAQVAEGQQKDADAHRPGPMYREDPRVDVGPPSRVLRSDAPQRPGTGRSSRMPQRVDG